MADFKYYNNNPEHLTTEDCVTRAITLASGLKYKTISRLLKLTAKLKNCDCLTMFCYRYLLEYILCYPVRYAHKDETVESVIAKYPHNTLLIRIDGHLLCSVAGVIYDLFDSSKEPVTCYWIAK